MKKYLALMLATVLMTGCSLFQKEVKKSDPPKPVPAASSDFEEVMGQMHDANVDWLLGFIPETEVPVVSEQNFELTGTVTPPVPDVEEATFALTSNGKSDMSNENDPKAESTLAFSGEVTGQQTGDAEAEIMFKVVNQKIMASLTKLSANMDGEAFPVELFVAEYMNNWYGVTFDEINQMYNDATGDQSFDIADSFKNPNEYLQDIKNRLGEALGEVHMWKLVEELPEENGMLKYKVELDKDALKAGMIALAKFATSNPDGSVREYEFDQAKSEIEGAFSEDFSVEGILSVDKNNVRFFSFEGTATNPRGETAELAMTWLESEMLFTVSAEGETPFKFEKTGDDYALEVEGTKVMDGTYDGLVWTADVYDDYSGDQVGSFEFTKVGENEYTGSISVPEENV